MFLRALLPAIAALMLTASHAAAQFLAPIPWSARPFTDTLSNNTPLAFGMSADDVATALQSPLTYVSGRPGHEMFVTPRIQWGAPFFQREGQLYLQFRQGRLTGWKGDWERNWMWR